VEKSGQLSGALASPGYRLCRNDRHLRRQ
jgi:hypothetical protein